VVPPQAQDRLHEARVPNIVCIAESNQFVTSTTYATIPRGGYSPICLVDDFDPRCPNFQSDFMGPVCRAVVDNQNLVGKNALSEERAQRARNRQFRIECWNDNGNSTKG
jgi:hypothetical protein